MPGLVRVAAAQIEIGPDVAENLAACLRVIDVAAGRGAQLVVLPEFCNHLAWYESRDQARRQASRLGDTFLTTVAERARAHRIWVKINVTLAHSDGTTGGTNILFTPDGQIAGTCDKQLLIGAENDFLTPGSTVGPVIGTPIGRLGMYACMEGVISEVTRGLALRGAQILLNSLNSFAIDEAELHIPVRAAENKVWVVAANKVGPLLPRAELPAIAERLGIPPEQLDGAGESQIVAPDGTVLAKAPRTGEAVIVADVDPERADDKRRPDGTDLFRARRPELYAPLAAPPYGRHHPPGAKSLPVAVARTLTAVKEAVEDGAQLVVMPEISGTSGRRFEDLLSGSSAHLVTVVDGVGVLIGATGIIGTQPQLHGGDGDGVMAFALEWGRLAIVAGRDAVHPESFRLAALQDADVVAVPYDALEDWELALGLPERAAENRLNLVVAKPFGQPAAIFGLSPDFTLWTRWEGAFTGRISTPIRIDIGAESAGGIGVVAPAQATNRLVSRQTDLVDGRPWRLLGALVETATGD